MNWTVKKAREQHSLLTCPFEQNQANLGTINLIQNETPVDNLDENTEENPTTPEKKDFFHF